MRRSFVLMGCALALALVAQPARAGKHKDEKLGYSINVPKKWAPMPMSSSGDSWVVAKFISPRQYEWSDAKTNSWDWHKPYLDVVIIPHSVAEKGGRQRQ